MATTSPNRSHPPMPPFTLLLLLFSATWITFDASIATAKEINMVFYLHDLFAGNSATAVAVAGRSKKATVTEFGTIIAIDDSVTRGPERSSFQVGRAQGIDVNSALDGSDAHLVFSIIFTNIEEYNGSTLEIQGADRYLLGRREVSVMSGTGLFRFARGFAAVLETVYFSSSSYEVVKFNVTVRHY